jgi:hypothetical protein
MRALNPTELILIEFLASSLENKISCENLTVYNIFPDDPVIRNSEIGLHHPVSVASDGVYIDSDGEEIFVTLFVTHDDKFGELLFWKGSGEPILTFPQNVTELRNLNDLLNKPE